MSDGITETPAAPGGSTLNRTVIAPGDSIKTYEVSDDDAGRAVFKKVWRDNVKRVGILICYCSVLDQCWLAGGGGRFEDIDHDQELDECPIAKQDQFGQ